MSSRVVIHDDASELIRGANIEDEVNEGSRHAHH